MSAEINEPVTIVTRPLIKTIRLELTKTELYLLKRAVASEVISKQFNGGNAVKLHKLYEKLNQAMK